MIDVGDGILIVMLRTDGHGHSVGVVTARGFAVSVGQGKVAFSPKGERGKVWFAPRDRVFKDGHDGVLEAIGRAQDLADELGVEVL